MDLDVFCFYYSDHVMPFGNVGIGSEIFMHGILSKVATIDWRSTTYIGKEWQRYLVDILAKF